MWAARCSELRLLVLPWKKELEESDGRLPDVVCGGVVESVNNCGLFNTKSDRFVDLPSPSGYRWYLSIIINNTWINSFSQETKLKRTFYIREGIKSKESKWIIDHEIPGHGDGSSIGEPGRKKRLQTGGQRIHQVETVVNPLAVRPRRSTFRMTLTPPGHHQFHTIRCV